MSTSEKQTCLGGTRCLISTPTTHYLDDIEAMTSLYGPYASFDATTETYGGVPLEVCFSLSSTSALSSVDWLYGDGQGDSIDIASEDDYEICHTYENKGQYTVNVTISGTSDECGEWEYTDRERAMVVVCEPPEKADGFDGMFTAEHHEGLIYQMVNQADISCMVALIKSGGMSSKVMSSSKRITWSPKSSSTKEGSQSCSQQAVLAAFQQKNSQLMLSTSQLKVVHLSA